MKTCHEISRLIQDIQHANFEVSNRSTDHYTEIKYWRIQENEFLN